MGGARRDELTHEHDEVPQGERLKDVQPQAEVYGGPELSIIKSYVIMIIIIVINHNYNYDHNDHNNGLYKQSTQKRYLPHQNHSYEKVRTIIDTESNVVSKSATNSISKSKIATETWDYIRPPRSDKPDQKRNNYILYCKHCLLETAYSSHIIINFCNHLVKKYYIVIEKHQNTILITASNDFDQLYKRLYKSG